MTEESVEAVNGERRAVGEGHDDAMLKLGLMYDMGQPGVPEYNVRAVKMYELAAEEGFLEAMINLAVMYDEGQSGVPEDNVKAVQWYEAAADEDRLTGVIEHLLIRALTIAHDRREHQQAAAGGKGEDSIHDLLHGLALDGTPALGAVRVAGAGVEETEIVVDLRLRGNGGSRVAGGALLVDGDGGR